MPNDGHNLKEDPEERLRLESHAAGEGMRLSDGRGDVGEAFADPNSLDDAKLGNSFEESNSSAKKHHRPIKEAVAEPFRKAKSNKALYWIVAGVVLLMLLGLIVGVIPRLARKQSTDEEAKRQERKPEIEVVKVVRSRGGGGLVVPGTTIPMEESSVYGRANGYIKRRLVDIGDHVRKGQLLAVIDAPELDAQVEQARQQVDQARAQLAQQRTQLALTKVTTERYRALAERGVFSRQDADQREADYEAQVANVAAAERNVEAFQANLQRAIALEQYERVTAPFDGIVTQRNVDTGDLIQASGAAGSGAPMPVPTGSVSSGTTQNGASNTSGSGGMGSNLATPATGQGGNGGSLFTIAQVKRLRILISVPEGYAGLIHSGQHTALNFQEFPDVVFHGDVTRSASAIDQNTRTMLVEVQVDNSAGRLLPGMYAVVTFAAPGKNDGGDGPLLITGDAIAIRNDQPTVAVIGQGKVHLQPVVIGRDYGSETEILEGLHEGDLIAASFTDDITEGASVRTQLSQEQQEKATPAPTAEKPNPPGGSTQYGDPGIVDQDMQGQNAKPQQKKSNNGQQKKAAGKQGSKP